jgi:hypothetical protein
MENRIFNAIRTKILKRPRYSCYSKTKPGRRRLVRNSFADANSYVELLICIVLLPVLIPLVIYAGLKWIVGFIFRLRFNVKSSFWFLVEREKYFKSLCNDKEKNR